MATKTVKTEVKKSVEKVTRAAKIVAETKKPEVKIVLTKASLDVFEEKDKNGNIKVAARLNKPETKLAQSVIEKAARYRELQAQAELIKQEQDEIKEFFKSELKDKNLDFLYASEYKICYSKSESIGFDSKTFEAKYPKLFAEFKTKVTQSEKVVINQGK